MIFFTDCGEFPTLLHFSACHGLSKLTSVLLDCVGSNDAIQMRNASEMTPAELANVNGHFDLANKLHSLHVDLYKYLSSSIGGGQVKHDYDYVSTQKSNYQIPPPPRPVHQLQSGSEHLETHHATSHGTKWNLVKDKIQDDPFGTLRASKKISPSPEDSDDEVFITNDKFGTLKANKMMQDYRETPSSGQNNNSEELAITDEFLKLLDDLQSKNYSAKEMESLFENWKRKADLKVNNTKDKTKKQRTTNLILKLFKNHGLTHSQSDPYIKATKDTKTYRKPSKPEMVEKPEEFQDVQDLGPMPIMENQSIIEGEITIINAEDLELMEQNQDQSKKSSQESSNEGISTQILPLSRLSLSSNGSPPEPLTASKKDLRPIGNSTSIYSKFNTKVDFFHS